MQQFELRVHYGAPSLVKDDTRWQKLAQNIASFRANRKLSISDEVDVGVAGQRTSSPESDWSITSTELLSSGQSSTNTRYEARSHRGAGKLLSIDGRTNKRKVTTESVEDPRDTKRNKRTTFARAKKGLNPAFKNPIASLLKTGKQVERTPALKRPNSAPENTVLVPFTATPKPRRSKSDTATASHCCLEVSFSDLCPTSRVDDTSFESQDSSAFESLEIRPITVSDNHQDETVELETQLVEEEMTIALSQTSLQESDVNIGTCDPNFKHSSLYEQDLDHEQQSSATPPSSTSTETASNPDRYIINSSPLAHLSTSNMASTSIVDLTSEIDESQKEVTKRDVLGPVSSPIRGIDDYPSATPPFSTRQIQQKIRSLPKRIYCSGPTNSGESFKSFVPQSLRELAEMFDLINHFRPVEAVKSIRNVERGYWKMLIKITSLAIVAKSRRSPLSASQWSDERFMLVRKGQISTATPATDVDDAMHQLHYREKATDAYTPWTLEEFTDFWTLMKKTIERGRAGYDVHATITDNMVKREDGLEFEVRFYGYAESLSHMWCVLFVQSNKAAGHMPMQWVATGRGPLIRMSGQPKRGGRIGRWIELSPGVEGSWGLEEAWDGIASTT
ncbi:hypothetical protein H2198_004115 [Neophaeococcomyces mojaviensis]|uniref:Uncharacterized protein n=1 Tax=Neophaeococcomyces mojaviensis TaxID=3383035 RepID=A0ACC3A9N3_9EURO|nr:hypothetical protein H2198_004115 [Knufia sp. JES_112]